MTDLIGNLGSRVRTRIGLLALGLAALVGFGIGAAVMAPRSTDASTAQACTRTVATLLTTQNAVELERSRYLVAELGCSVRGVLPALEAVADVGTSLPHTSPPPPAYDLGDMLLTFLWGFPLFVAVTLAVTWLLDRLTDPKPKNA